MSTLSLSRAARQVAKKRRARAEAKRRAAKIRAKLKLKAKHSSNEQQPGGRNMRTTTTTTPTALAVRKRAAEIRAKDPSLTEAKASVRAWSEPGVKEKHRAEAARRVFVESPAGEETTDEADAEADADAVFRLLQAGETLDEALTTVLAARFG